MNNQNEILATQFYNWAIENGLKTVRSQTIEDICRDFADESFSVDEVINTSLDCGFISPPFNLPRKTSWGRTENEIHYKIIVAEDIPIIIEDGEDNYKGRLVKELLREVPEAPINEIQFKDLGDEMSETDLLAGIVYIDENLPLGFIPDAFFHAVGHVVDPSEIGETTEEFAEKYKEEKLKGKVGIKKVALFDLKDLDKSKKTGSDENLNQYAQYLAQVLEYYNVGVDRIVPVNKGPRAMRFGVYITYGRYISEVERIKDEIALSFGVDSVSISTIGGRLYVDIPRRTGDVVSLIDVLSSDEWNKFKGAIPLSMGVLQDGSPLISDLAKMPHLLVGGATQSGKSVFLHALILGMMYHFNPDQLKFLLIDTKRVEFSLYKGFPYGEVYTRVDEIIERLSKLVEDMEERYDYLEKERARNITETDLAYLIVVIDEVADLMAQGGKQVVKDMLTLLRKARAVGIHFICATQRPSADVIPGDIKANMPGRVSFQVASSTDSMVILNEPGAEDLLGLGDGLYEGNRFQSPLVTTEEIERVVNDVEQKY